jgi:hypothetical protein
VWFNAANAFTRGIAVAGSDVAHYTSGTERMRIDSLGRVGIGTTTPAEKLDIRGGDLQVSRGAAGVAADAVIGFGSNTNNYIYSGNSSNIMAFFTNGSERVRINNAGNVGIGTSSPAQTLQVVNAGNYQFRLGGGGSINYDMGRNASNGLFYLYGNQTGFTGYVFDGVDGERMRITSAGNVGVGTSSPAGLLHVNSTSTTNAIVSGSDAARLVINGDTANSGDTGTEDASLIFETDGAYSSAVNSGLGSSGFRLGLLNGAAASTLVFVDILSGVDRERMRIDGSGNVGIGTSSPTASLSVVGAQTLTRGLDMGITGVDATCYVSQKRATVETIMGPLSTRMLFGTISNHDVAVQTNNTERMRILNTGLVGIGTSAPTTQLDVHGSGSLALRRNTTDSTAQVLLSQAGTGDSLIDFLLPSVRAWRMGIDNSDADKFKLQPSQTADFSGAVVTVDVSGNVGIGTSSPGAKLDVVGDIRGTTAIALGAGLNNDNRIEIGAGRTGSNFAYIDLIGDTTYTDFGMRMIRGNAGPNASSEINHRGTGDFILNAVDAASLRFLTSGTERMRFDSAGTASFLGLLVGRSSASTDVNTANDTGSFSVRGSNTTIASMSFHRTGAFAINMGLGTDNVFRIGGWSASSNAFQMDSTGNLTMLGNVTAYSDARIKKDVETIDSALDLVSKMRGVRYTRIDTQKRGVGVIAQEMLEVCPEVVQQGVGDDDTLSVAYGNLVGVLIEAVKELTARVAELEGK